MSMPEAVQAFQQAESGFGERMQARGVLFDPALGVEAGLLAALPHLLPSGKREGVEAVVFKHPASVRSAAAFLLAKFEHASCDSSGVSCCIRCSAVAMSRWAIEALDSSLVAQPRAVPDAMPMDTAPHDGSMLRLLVQFEEHATEDTTEPAWTIGAYSEGADGWQFAGWCWSHDHFTEGKGTPVGWLPMLDEQPRAVPDGMVRVLDGLSDALRMHKERRTTYKSLEGSVEDALCSLRAMLATPPPGEPSIEPPLPLDTQRMNKLEELAEGAFVGMCFEIDGGVHMTVEAPSVEAVAYRHRNSIRHALDDALEADRLAVEADRA
jgi:hypothetical protein